MSLQRYSSFVLGLQNLQGPWKCPHLMLAILDACLTSVSRVLMHSLVQTKVTFFHVPSLCFDVIFFNADCSVQARHPPWQFWLRDYFSRSSLSYVESESVLVLDNKTQKYPWVSNDPEKFIDIGMCTFLKWEIIWDGIY